MRLLLVEDSKRLQDLLGETLREAGYRLDVAATAQDFRQMAVSVPYDLFIVDLGLPDGDGVAEIRALRLRSIQTPVLVITARATVDDRIAGLDSGADDYLIKPFNHSELLARVRALLRRPVELAGPELNVGHLRFNEANGEVFYEDIAVDLRPSERRLLALLMRRGGSVVSKSSIEVAVSEFGREISPNAVEALVSRLRKALSDVNARVSLTTIRGSGYVLREEKD